MFFKKKEHKKLDNDDFDFDDDFNLDDEGSYDVDLDMSSRNPISQIAGDFTSGMKSSATSSSNHKRILREALPSNYSYAYDAQDVIRNEFKDGYRSIKDEGAKQVNNFKVENQRIIKKASSLLPGKLGKKLDDWGSNVDFQGGRDNTDYEEMALNSQLGEIFNVISNVKAQEASNETAVTTQTEIKAQTAIALDSQEALLGSNTYLGRLVEYQDNINAKYQRKMLELTFRQLYVSRKSLDVNEQLKDITKASLEAIAKNTALPDVQKIRDRELLGSITRQKFLGDLTEDMTKSLSGFTTMIGGKITKKATQFLADSGKLISGASKELGDAILGDEDGSGAIPLSEILLGEVAGRMTDMASEYAIKKLGESGKVFAGKDGVKDKVAYGDSLINYMRSRGANWTNENLLTGNTGIELIDKFANFFDLGSGSVKYKDTIARSSVDSMNDVSLFDNKTHRTINDIIPELLGKIHQETRRFNGETADEIVRYDWETNEFSSTSAINARLHKRITDDNSLDRFDESTRAMLRTIDPAGELQKNHPEAVAKIVKDIAIAGMTGRDISLLKYIDRTSSRTYDKVIADHIEKTFGDSYNSAIDGTEASYILGGNLSKGFLDADNSINETRNASKYRIKDPMEKLLAQAGQGNVAELLKLGYVTRDDKGLLKLDASKYYDRLLEDDEALQASRTKPMSGEDLLNQLPKVRDSGGFVGDGNDETATEVESRNRVLKWLTQAGVGVAGLGASAFAQAASVSGDLALNGITLGDGGTLSLIVGGTLAGSLVASNLFGKLTGDNGFYDPSKENPKWGKSKRAQKQKARYEARAVDSAYSNPSDMSETNTWLSKIYDSINANSYTDNLQGISSQITLLSDTLGVIAANMPRGGGVDIDIINTLGTGQRAILGAYDTGKATITKGMSLTGSLLKNYYKGLGKLGGFALSSGKTGFKWGKDTVGELLQNGIHPIYVKGKAVPALTAAGLGAQEYVDVNTKTIVKGVSDITGQVTNHDGSITFITQEDFDNFGVEEREKGLFGKAVKLAGQGASLAVKPYTTAFNIVKSAYNYLDGFTFPSGIFIAGEDSPRLDYLSLIRGYYRVASTGKVVKSLRDLTGDIIDRNGNVVLTLDQITQGIYDKTGTKIDLAISRLKSGLGTGIEKAWGITKTVASIGADVIGSIGSWGVNAFKGAAARIAKWRDDHDYMSLISFGSYSNSTKQLEETRAIRKLLEDRWVNPKESAYNDKDDDGDRDGSYQDKIQQEKDEKKQSWISRFTEFFAGKKKEDKDGEEKESLFSRLMGGMGTVLTAVVGTALKVGLPLIIGKFGMDAWLENYANKDVEIVKSDDPRLDPNSPEYDKDLKPGPQEKTITQKGADWMKDQPGWVQLLAGGAAAGLTMTAAGKLLKAPGALLGLAGQGIMKGGAAMAARNVARGGRGGILGAAATAGRGAGFVGKIGLGVAKFGLRTLMGPVGLLWTAYEVISWGMKKLDENSVGNDALLRMRMAAYGYEITDKDKTAFFLGLENKLTEHTKVSGGRVFIANSISMEDVKTAFDVDGSNQEAVANWEEYFFKRFIPVYETFATIMYNYCKSKDVTQMDSRLDPSQRLGVASSSLFSRDEQNPYDVLVSGFIKDGELEVDRQRVADIYKLVSTSLQKEHEETKGKYISERDASDTKLLEERTKQIEKLTQERVAKNETFAKKLVDYLKSDSIHKWIKTKAQGASEWLQSDSINDWIKEKFGNFFGGSGVPTNTVGGGTGTTVRGLGDIAEKYESGGAGVSTVSTGAGDRGGVSYGSHQLSSKTGTMAAFLQSAEGSKFASAFSGMAPGSAAFNAKYKEIAASRGDEFKQAQRDYITRTHYLPAKANAEKYGFDMSHRGIQEAIYSHGTQYGPGHSARFKRVAASGVNMKDNVAVIKALYADKAAMVNSDFSSSSAKTREGVSKRIQNELNDVLAVSNAGGTAPTAATATATTAGSSDEAVDAVEDDNKSKVYVIPAGANLALVKSAQSGNKASKKKLDAIVAANKKKAALKGETPVASKLVKPGTRVGGATNNKSGLSTTGKAITPDVAPNMAKGDKRQTSAAGNIIGTGNLIGSVVDAASKKKEQEAIIRASKMTETEKTARLNALGRAAPKNVVSPKDDTKNATTDKSVTPDKNASTGAPVTAPKTGTLSTTPVGSRPYKAAMHAVRNAVGSSTGRCAQKIREALQAAGYSWNHANASAYMYGTKGTLEMAGFAQIATTTPWQVGDVMVFQNNGAHPHGHIQIYAPRGWTSDFTQNRWQAYRRDCPPFKLYRDKQYLNGAAGGSGWVAADSKNVTSAGDTGTTMASDVAGASAAVAYNNGLGWVPKGQKLLTADELWGRTEKALNEKVIEPAGAKDAKVDAVEKDKAEVQVKAKSTPTSIDPTNPNIEPVKKVDKTQANKPSAAKPKDFIKAKVVDVDESAIKRERELERLAKIEKESKLKKAQLERVARESLATSANSEVHSILSKQLEMQTNIHNVMKNIGDDIAKVLVGFNNPKPQDKVQPVKTSTPAQAPRKAIEALKEPVSLLKM